MSKLSSRCPKCGSDTGWREVVNPFTSGIPVGQGRFRLLKVKGLLAGPLKRQIGYNRVKYRCRDCGFEQTQELLR